MGDRSRILFRSVSKRFAEVPVIADLDLEVGAGEFIAIIGHSGTGKSTLLRMIAGLERADGGEVIVDGEIAFAFQEPRLIPWLSVGRNVTLGLEGSERDDIALRALEEVGIADKQRVWPLTLSGGQAQRASLARALVREPEILLLDEPLGALDALTRLTLQNLIAVLRDNHGWTVVMVTHDVEEAVRLADRVIVLGGGAIRETVEVPGRGPRALDDPGLTAIAARLLRALGVEPL